MKKISKILYRLKVMYFAVQDALKLPEKRMMILHDEGRIIYRLICWLMFSSVIEFEFLDDIICRLSISSVSFINYWVP